MLSRKLSPQKRKFISLVKSEDIINYQVKDLIKELGISKSTYYRWLKDKEIAKIIVQEFALEINENLPEIKKILLEKARQDDINSIVILLKIYDNNKNGRDVIDGLTIDEIVETVHIVKGHNIPQCGVKRIPHPI